MLRTNRQTNRWIQKSYPANRQSLHE